MARAKSASVEQQREVEKLVMEEFGAAQIHRQLESSDELREPRLSLRTVQRMVRELKPDDLSGRWSMAEADPEEAALVLDALAFLFDETEGRAWLTKDRARWIARIRTACPTIGIEMALWAAWRYQRLHATGGDTRYLDLLLGARPWEGSEENRQWFRCMGALASKFPDGVEAASEWMPMAFGFERLDLRDFLVDHGDEEDGEIDEEALELASIESVTWE